ncbi:MAG: phosphomannomutase [Alphaproteobacteria bacterium HGW-Alphaproteobacteria-6]|nr:MAG: phosphomannomutase [Alphaproteobacteria bacterium HGW-Alphaproteobacteria-6]
MAPKFGTSGLRGLVTDLTPALVGDHVAAFVAACPTGAGLYLGRDLRPSSPAIADAVMRAARDAGLAVTDCGALPTPALALAAMTAGAAAVMVTGSHIPADRNGLKFYTPAGEITKAQEQAILAVLGRRPDAAMPGPAPRKAPGAAAAYVARYRDAFGAGALAGLRIGLYAHSSVGRGAMAEALAVLGAEVVTLGWSEAFIPVDTEAVDAATRAMLCDWARAGQLDAIASADGDADRPLLTDATGAVIAGDILGQITAAALGADIVVTPVSSNGGAELGGRFARVLRTRIGSPHVIAAMEEAGGRVAGYEANGGFLLGFAAEGPAGGLAPLMTRDCLLPIIATLWQARGRGLADLVAAEPARFTAADRLQDVPTDRAGALVAAMADGPAARRGFLGRLGLAEAAADQTDGLRITAQGGRVVHVRPSGNAPELRLYAEAESPAAAAALLAAGLAELRRALDHFGDLPITASDLLSGQARS